MQRKQVLKMPIFSHKILENLVNANSFVDMLPRRVIKNIYFPNFIALVLSIIFIVINLSYILDWSWLIHDLSSYAAPAASLAQGYGIPYADYFDIKPPALIALFVPFYWFTSKALTYIYIAYAILMAFSLWIFWDLIGKILSRLQRFCLYMLVLLSLLASGSVHTMPVTSEVIGMFLVLAAFDYTLSKNNNVSLIIGAFLCIMASQMKEVHIFSTIALLPLSFIRPNPIKRMLLVGLGILCGATFSILMLQAWGSLPAYLEVLTYKKESFPFPGNLVFNVIENLSIYFRQTSILNSTGSIMVLTLFGFIYGFRYRKSANLANQYLLQSISILCLGISLVIGFVWQNKEFNGHYAYTLIIAISLVIAALSSISLEQKSPDKKSALIKGVLYWFPIILFVPTLHYFKSFVRAVYYAPYNNIINGWARVERFPSNYSRIKELKFPDGCIQVAYGWNSGPLYVYLGRRPCSRYFIAPLIGSRIAPKFKTELINNPPVAIYYITQGAGVNVKSFESDVFPYSNVLENCYVATIEPGLFVAANQGSRLRACINRSIQ